MNPATNRPPFATDEHLRFLDAVREGGSINMFGAAIPLREMFPELTKEQASAVLVYWMRSFSDRQRDAATRHEFERCSECSQAIIPASDNIDGRCRRCRHSSAD